MKTCTKCGIEKPLADYNLSKGKPRAYCKPCHRALAAAWQRANPESRKAIANKYARKQRADLPRKYPASKTVEERLARRLAARSKWAEANAERFTEMRKRWVAENPHKAMARVRRYQASKIKAVPCWALDSEIEKFYLEARRLTLETGIRHEVDHIVPLLSPKVCGLHVQHNLQVLPKRDNVIKGNRRWPDMP